jgi:excisionase family DNA binding protein
MKPSLPYLLEHRDAIADVARDDVPELVAELAAFLARLLARLSDVEATSRIDVAETPDRLLTVAEVAEVLGVDARWVYRKHEAGKLPFAMKLGPKTLRFSEQGLKRWLKHRAA